MHSNYNIFEFIMLNSIIYLPFTHLGENESAKPSSTIYSFVVKAKLSLHLLFPQTWASYSKQEPAC